MDSPQSTVSRYAIVTLVLGSLIVIFDVLRKTVFAGASWNYNYPYWNFVYSIPSFVFLALLLAAPILFSDRFLTLPRKRFSIAIYLITLSIAVISYLSLPVEAYHMSLAPSSNKISHDFLYHPATVLVREGPLEYFSSFHSLPTLSGADRLQTSRTLSELIGQLDKLPYNRGLAEYIATIITQRHGPVTPILVAPAMLILGVNPSSAVVGNYVLVSATPLIAYHTFRSTFEDRTARMGALLIAFTPALHIWLRHKTIPYDALTGVLVVLTFYVLYRAIRAQSSKLVITAGVVFSLAALSKITVLTLLLPIGAVLVFRSENELKDGGLFVIGSLMIPILLIPLGYNFVAQYLFDVGRVVISSPGQATASDPASYLQRPLLGHLSAWYNTRLVGIHALILIPLTAWHVVQQSESWTSQNLIGVAGVLSIIPFFALSGLTLARHLLPFLLPVGLFYLIGLQQLRNGDQLPLMKSLLAINGLLLLVNL